MVLSLLAMWEAAISVSTPYMAMWVSHFLKSNAVRTIKDRELEAALNRVANCLSATANCKLELELKFIMGSEQPYMSALSCTAYRASHACLQT